MNRRTFRALLNMLVAANQWPAGSDGERAYRVLVEWVDGESKRKGYDDWWQAYQHFPRKIYRAVED